MKRSNIICNEDFTFEDAHTFIGKVARYSDQSGLIIDIVHWQVKKRQRQRAKEEVWKRIRVKAH